MKVSDPDLAGGNHHFVEPLANFLVAVDGWRNRRSRCFPGSEPQIGQGVSLGHECSERRYGGVKDTWIRTVIATTTVLTFVNQRVWADAVLLLGSIGDPYRIRRRHCTQGARHPYCLGRLGRRTRAGTKVTTHLMPQQST